MTPFAGPLECGGSTPLWLAAERPNRRALQGLDRLPPRSTAPIFVALLLALLAGPRERGADVVVEPLAKGWQIRNAHYSAIVRGSGGGLLSSLSDPQGRPVLNRFDLYTDHGIFDGRRYVGSSFDPTPTVTHSERDGKHVFVTEGRFLAEGEGKPAQPTLRYRAELTFGASPAIGVRLTLTPELSAKPSVAFLAHAVGLPDAAELFALTADGLLCQDAATRSDRTWQSRGDPLDRRKPIFGACTKGGGCLVFSDIRSTAGLDNVFAHESGRRSLTAFLAWCDGPTRRTLAKGQLVDLAYTLTVLTSTDQLRAMLE